MSANEIKLADFILNNASLIRDYSSQQIAHSVGVSQSSVIKFSQKMGYKGFTDLKLAIHETVVKQESNVAVLHGGDSGASESLSLKEKIYQVKSDALMSVSGINVDETLLAAAEAIQQASRVQIAGSGRARSVIQETLFRLLSRGKTVFNEEDPELELLRAGTLDRGDCLLIISEPGQSAHLGRLAKEAGQRDAVVVSLTSQSANPVAALSDIRLFSVPGGGEADFPDITASASQQHVMDLVFCTMAVHFGEKGNSDRRGDLPAIVASVADKRVVDKRVLEKREAK